MSDATVWPVIVKNFKDEMKFHVLHDDGKLERAERRPPAAAAVGLGDFVSRIFGFDTLSVAICALDEKLKLFVGSLVVDVLDQRVTVTRTPIFPFIKRFSINAGGQHVFTYTYTYVATDALEEPMNGTRDILKFVADVGPSAERKLRLYYVWKAIQQGQNIADKDVTDAIDAAVAGRIAK